ncbi:SRPBCC family protein [Luteolibacter yonseiensis]|uniref:SRPBCC family protein n=1 Tax=Luteolibacter yonseiensis TaxID=1144680 RepID=A0A934VAS4_9BACT|nr:SRPBCC family protein [Luteolibacter yonseiensis]MBK1815181.1 SRPBCC family protein [Luteolibacter yonseiensis]
MPLIQLKTKIEAPLERVFDLARSIDAHMASTEGTNERAIAGRTSGLIEMGETVTWEATHFGVKQRLAVRVISFDRPHLFSDEMISGAFASMKHVHRFSFEGTGTLMSDEFHFSAPLGILGRAAERMFLTRYMTRFLAARSLALKELAESDGWRRYLPPEAELNDKENSASPVPHLHRSAEKR